MDSSLPETECAVNNLSLQANSKEPVHDNEGLTPDKRTANLRGDVASGDSLSDDSSWVLVDGHTVDQKDNNVNKKSKRMEGTPLSRTGSESAKSKFLIRDWLGLFNAVRENSHEKVASLLKKEAAFPSFGSHSLDSHGADGSTLLYQAILDGRASIVELLLEFGADPNVTRRKWPRESCLQQTALLGREDLIQLLLKHGANVLLEDGTCQTALHATASKGNITLASLLLRHGAEINQRGSSKLVTSLAMAVKNSQMSMVEFLITQGADVTADRKAFEYALTQDATEMVRFLLKNGAASKLSPKDLGLFLVDRIKLGKEPKVVTELLEHGAPADVENGEPLECAIDNFKQNPVVGLLLDHGADARLKRSPYNYAETMEERAIHTGNPGIVKAFLEKGLRERSRIDVLRQYLRYAASLPDDSTHLVVKFLIDQGAPGNLTTSSNYPTSGTMMSPLQWAARNRDLEMAETCLNKGDDIEGLSVCHTPLQWASMNSDEAMARLLLFHGAYPDQIGQNRIGKLVQPQDRPLQLAVNNKHLGITKLLLDAGANVNLATSAASPLASACRRRDVAFVDLLLFHGARPIVSDFCPADPLFTACSTGDETIVQKLLLSRNFSTEDMRSTGVKALHIAGKLGHLGILKLLVENGGDIHGWWCQRSLLFEATNEGNDAVVRYLVEMGADPTAKGDSRGVSALQKAIETCDETLINALSG